ncbi:hypothetical protein CTA2_10031 [Colletotrichum tanaceti]|uniref:Uncharacterized protein n=1 Tax=Colletotrichum tanaceti TaxID=1306861 RepID=A0A4U6XJX3_9PEZI|nr:hypothetical protein CTA2_10031 [Colletotrichum tanaceti]TKW55829.1 hypothetical protein CTA1_8777 [Colletotrichum tanaceti]
MAASISRVTLEHHRLPFGIAETQPRISWRFDGNDVDWENSAYDVDGPKRPIYSIKSFPVGANITRARP